MFNVKDKSVVDDRICFFRLYLGAHYFAVFQILRVDLNLEKLEGKKKI